MHDHHDVHHHDLNGHQHGHTHSAPGHNRGGAAQWQVPHLAGGEAPEPEPERDLDLVETSFVEGFARCSDPTSFLRLAGIPFVGLHADGRRLHLLRVETESLTDVGSVSPLLGGAGVRYDPMPVRMVSQRRSLAFVYHDGSAVARLDFAAARRLSDASASSRIDLGPAA